MSMKTLCLAPYVSLALVCGGLEAQTRPSADAVVKAFPWRNIGPANMGGRIVDIEAVEDDWRRVFMAHASGGVWKSINAGTSWEPIFDDYAVSSIGDIAVFQPNPDVVWVGTGEANNRNSVSWGNGVYRSTDGGETFTHLGLEDTHQIARVVTHPEDAGIAYVAAVGHLWGYSGDRGLFKTEDGGASWQKLGGGLPDDGVTGATDLVMDPESPDTLYVAMYHRLRKPYVFHSGGPNGGIYKSTDGGGTWRKLTQGLPTGDTGRIGLAMFRRNPRILMALVEAEQTGDLSRPGSGVYRSEDGGDSWTYVNTYNNRPFYYSQIRINPIDHQRVYVLTTRFMVSTDGGRTLVNGSPDEEIHGDFHTLWSDPNDADRYYIGQDKGAFLTHDHGEHFLMFDNIAMGQYYRLGVDMRDPYYVYGGMQDNGTWGGPSFSRDVRGILNDSNWKLHWGDGMHIQIDPDDWRRVYTEAENGSFRRYDAVTYETSGSRPAAGNISNLAEHYPDLARAGGRGGRGGRGGPFRFNWTAPLVMSPHDPDTLFLGGNHLFKTTDRGDSWTIVSPDLSTGDASKYAPEQTSITRDLTGAELHCTITSVSLSPIDEAVMWAGTDDGNVQVTTDGGRSWLNVRDKVPGVPGGIWVSRVEASHFDLRTAYLSFDGHRSDDFAPWVFRTEDYGRTWTDIGSNLPGGQVVRVIREDPRNPDLLFAGTEFGVFASIDKGESWHRFMTDLPTVPVYDLIIHPRDHDLIAGTHGRSIWIADDISPLQQLSQEVMASFGHLFEQRPATLWENVSRGGQRGHHWFAGENPPTIEPTSSLPRARFRNMAQISYWLNPPPGIDATLEIAEIGADNKRVVSVENAPGIGRYMWDLSFDPPPMSEEQVAEVAVALEAMASARGGRARGRRGGQGRRGRGGDPRQALERFRAAENDAERYAAIAGLGGQLGVDTAGATAGPGSYLLTLRVGYAVSHGTLEVREDPLLKESGR